MIRIGTRGSKLALWQAHDLKDKLGNIDVQSEIVIIKTRGDQIQHLSFDKIEGKGFFTKEIEDALLNDNIDVAVHSLKDLPTVMDEQLVLAGLSERADPSDILIINKEAVDPSRILKLKVGARVGTSSIRRQVQLAKFDKEAQIVAIRGNVPTRINRIDKGEVDAVILASAGVDRLAIDLSAYHVIRFNPVEFVPAPAQGVVGYQCRKSDKTSRKRILGIHNDKIAPSVKVERTVLNLLDGGCQLPLGTYVHQDAEGNYHAQAVLGSTPGEDLKHVSCSRSTTNGLAQYIVEQLNA